jgi:hypothetical protein
MAARGEPMTLQQAGQADLPVKGKLSMKSRKGGDVIANSFDGSDLYIQIGNTELAAAGRAAPVRTDTIVDSAGKPFVIAHVDTRRNGAETVAHFLWITG